MQPESQSQLAPMGPYIEGFPARRGVVSSVMTHMLGTEFRTTDAGIGRRAAANGGGKKASSDEPLATASRQIPKLCRKFR